MRLTREQILERGAQLQMERELVVIPELGGDVYVRGMSGAERDQFEEGLRVRTGRRAGQTDLRNFRARFAVRVIVDEQGQRLLEDGDIGVLGRLPASTLDRIIATCTRLSGQTEEELRDLGNASASAASDGSASHSPEN